MRNCKMMLSGSDRHVEFFCDRCAVGGEVIEVRSRSGAPLSKKHKIRQPGVCVSCAGSGRDETLKDSSKACLECGGSKVCPECNGQYSRSWNDLPITAQSKVLSRLDSGEDLLAGYEMVHGMFRTFS